MAGRVCKLSKLSGIGQRTCSTGTGLKAIVQTDPAAAGQLIREHLTPEELGKFQQAFAEPGSATHEPNGTPPKAAALLTVAIASGIPFIGFGFLDNFIMILAGEQIEASVGVRFALSTMAAAGLGNIVSDIAGLGFADIIEAKARKLSWCREPPLSITQRAMYTTRASKVGGAVVGITIGGLLGLMPLLWISDPDMKPAVVNEADK